MKKAFTLVAVSLLILAVASTAFAGGDKVRGEKGEGEVRQVQVMDPFPFD